jgi:hypothetical protein
MESEGTTDNLACRYAPSMTVTILICPEDFRNAISEPVAWYLREEISPGVKLHHTPAVRWYLHHDEALHIQAPRRARRITRSK